MITELYFDKGTGRFWSKETADQLVTTSQVEMALHVREQNGITVAEARDFVENVRLYYGGEPRSKSVRAGRVIVTKLYYDPKTKQFWTEETGSHFITTEPVEMAKHITRHSDHTLQSACKLVLHAKATYGG